MNYKKSFTLSEIMIAMAIFGIIAAACIPIVLNMSPNKNAIMIKKAYYTTEQIVSDLINDPIYYPTGNFAEDNNVMTEESSASLEKPTSFAKFSCLFARKMNIDETRNTNAPISTFCTRNSNGDEGNASDITKTNYILVAMDGSVWNFYNCPFSGVWGENGCRIDISATDDINNTLYDGQIRCIQDGVGWMGNTCGITPTLNSRLGKIAIFISADGGISLEGLGATSGQPSVAQIINGSANLLGKMRN